MDRTASLIFLAKAARTFCYGFLGILLPVHLSALGLGPRAIGIAITLILGGTAVTTLAVRRPSERFGSRAVLLLLAGLIVASGVLFAMVRRPGLVIAAAVLGNVAVSVGESGPFLSIEQVLLARRVTVPRLTMTMSLYNLVGYGAAALGALTVSLVGDADATGGLFEPSYVVLFWLFAASGATLLVLYSRLDPETAIASGRARPLSRSRGLVYRLAALFALDAVGGGFVIQSLVAYWFFLHFGLGIEGLGTVFSGTHVLTAVSFLLAARAAARFGLVNTMVFSHLISNFLLIGMAFAPTASVAVGLLLARHLLSQMDVPTRQAYLMAAVEDQEREAAATITNATRTVAQSLSPAVTGYIMQAVHLSAPFVIGGALKIVYDVLLYAAVRDVEPRT